MAKKLLEEAVNELINALNVTITAYQKDIEEIAMLISNAFKKGKKVLLCGNGGSASDCQHLAAEFVNRFKINRTPLPAIALTTDTSILTAISNDFTYDDVFKKQVEALGKTGDVLIGISTSGSSKNVIKALEVGKKNGLFTVGLSGEKDSPMKDVCDYLIKVASLDTPRIQEVHIFIGHMICEIVERSIFEE